jgi:hypothetical protein
LAKAEFNSSPELVFHPLFVWKGCVTIVRVDRIQTVSKNLGRADFYLGEPLVPRDSASNVPIDHKATNLSSMSILVYRRTFSRIKILLSEYRPRK